MELDLNFCLFPDLSISVREQLGPQFTGLVFRNSFHLDHTTHLFYPLLTSVPEVWF